MSPRQNTSVPLVQTRRRVAPNSRAYSDISFRAYLRAWLFLVSGPTPRLFRTPRRGPGTDDVAFRSGQRLEPFGRSRSYGVHDRPTVGRPQDELVSFGRTVPIRVLNLARSTACPSASGTRKLLVVEV